jgi:hypothetical protein
MALPVLLALEHIGNVGVETADTCYISTIQRKDKRI